MIAAMTTQRRWAVRWPDGSTTTGPTAQAILDRLAASPWNSGGPIKDLLADRAARMWGVKLDPTLPAADFIASMSTAGMVTLTRPAATHKEES